MTSSLDHFHWQASLVPWTHERLREAMKFYGPIMGGLISDVTCPACGRTFNVRTVEDIPVYCETVH